jgi:predicted nucleic acid-binding protein
MKPGGALGTLDAAIEPGAMLVLDTSVVLAYLAGGERTSGLATDLLDGFVATGRNAAAISAITVGEILLRPFRAGATAVSTAEGFLRFFAEIRIVDTDYGVARDAARIRAATGLRMPDAVVIASALAAKADVLITNDRSWRAAIGSTAPGLRLCVLEDLEA